MKLLFHFCQRRKWWFFCICIAALGTLISFEHLKYSKIMAELIVNITYVAEREDKLIHGVLELSKRMDKVSDKLNVVNRQIRSLDASVPHERTIKVKLIFYSLQ